MKGFVLSEQLGMFGGDVVGFGDSDLSVRIIERNQANDYIIANHYSGKVYGLSYIHLGVFGASNALQGALQYGYAMNPASCSTLVVGTETDQYLELNRMHLSDDLPRNSESRVIAYSLRYIGKKHPRVKWIQSFADERCGGLGVVYQACSFDYYGEHTATFWELDGEYFHNIAMTAVNGKAGRRGGAITTTEQRACGTPRFAPIPIH